MSELLSIEGENQAVRHFLANNANSYEDAAATLTKVGAQDWLRHLFDLETKQEPKHENN